MYSDNSRERKKKRILIKNTYSLNDCNLYFQNKVPD